MALVAPGSSAGFSVSAGFMDSLGLADMELNICVKLPVAEAAFAVSGTAGGETSFPVFSTGVLSVCSICVNSPGFTVAGGAGVSGEKGFCTKTCVNTFAKSGNGFCGVGEAGATGAAPKVASEAGPRVDGDAGVASARNISVNPPGLTGAAAG